MPLGVGGGSKEPSVSVWLKSAQPAVDVGSWCGGRGLAIEPMTTHEANSRPVSIPARAPLFLQQGARTPKRNVASSGPEVTPRRLVEACMIDLSEPTRNATAMDRRPKTQPMHLSSTMDCASVSFTRGRIRSSHVTAASELKPDDRVLQEVNPSQRI